ncbi:MAG TPA: glycerophosphodiester phosphodiesterase [Planctomycetes bacterium]|nr:glycerophosphodiester phosphodiesterase [Fuerstiella sp.]HIK91936.1 glycerophosphodiester phosphodiesterase [Planctomycetota bacterium]
MRNVSLTLLSFLSIFSAATANGQLIVAHRGSSYDAPENTLAAFRLAWEKQSDAIEGDFYVTSDDRIVCIHDRTTIRVAPKQSELTVAKSTLDELQKLDVGTWKHQRYSAERIPTLKQVLATVPDGKQIFVEIKCGPEILPLMKPQLAASGLKPEQIVIICFDQTVVTQSRKLMPEYDVNWLTGYKQKTKQSAWKPSQHDVLKILARTGATGLGTNGNLNVIDHAFVNSVRAAGFEFHVWTVNDVAPARQFADLGAFSITTDRPAFIRNAIQSVPVGTR